MSCSACLIVRQLVLNTLLIADKTVNTVLLGDPNETLSRRTARAADAGGKAAAAFCRVLGWFSPGHCAWALEPGSIGREIWSWSPVDQAQRSVTSPMPMSGSGAGTVLRVALALFLLAGAAAQARELNAADVVTALGFQPLSASQFNQALGVPQIATDGTLTTQMLRAAGASATRSFGAKAGDQLSIFDFGAACDGITNDSNAVIAAGASGRRVIVPDGLVCFAPNVAQSALAGVYTGGGKIRTNVGNPAGPYGTRGPQFASVTAPPNPSVWNQATSTEDNCAAGFLCWANFDYSHTLSAEEFHISGAGTLGQPMHGYEGMVGTNPHTLFYDSNSGWNQSHNSNDGRTGPNAYSVIMQHNGAGDMGVFGAQIFCGGLTGPGDGNTTAGPNGIYRGYTDWLAVPACGYEGGNISALTYGQYLQEAEFHISDQGYDVSAIGTAMGYNRTSTTPPQINNHWVHSLATCNLPPRIAGSIPCDAWAVVGGQWLYGLTFAGLPGGGQAVTYPIAMMAGQKVLFNAANNDGEGNPANITPGGDWLTDDGTNINLAVGGTIRAQITPAGIQGVHVAANGSVGVSCSAGGVSLSTLVIANGVVTHC